MKNHVWRPLYVVIGLVVLILLVKAAYVPDDFGVGEQGYMYGYHRQGNEQDWANFPVKYRGSDGCSDCHGDRVEEVSASYHAMVSCENCHGAALDHPMEPEKLTIDTSRQLCLRCHAQLVTPSSGRSAIPGIDPERHNADYGCSDCHNPHNPSLEDM